MSKSQMFKKAHQMTREVKAQFPQVNYRVQFGLSLAYLHNVKEEVKMVELKGTEKQVKWANDIREKVVNNRVKEIEEVKTTKSARRLREFLDRFEITNEDCKCSVEIARELIIKRLELEIEDLKSHEEASWFINMKLYIGYYD